MERANKVNSGEVTTYHDLISTLATMRIQKGWSQYELARRAGVAHTTVARMEALEYQPLLLTVMQIADALGYTLRIEKASVTSKEKC